MAITRLNNNSVTSVSALPNLASLPSGIPTGKVLQIVQRKISPSFSTSSTSYVDAGVSKTITPIASSSKILVSYHCAGWFINHKHSVKGFVSVTRQVNSGSFSMPIDPASYVEGRGTTGTDWRAGTLASFEYLDTPPSYSVSDTLTYKIQARISNGSYGFSLGKNEAHEVNQQYLTLYEIAN